ncbi:MAG: hypothetical protein WBA12_10605 [Catalinimonas sp.]
MTKHTVKTLLTTAILAGGTLLASCGKYNHAEDLTLDEQARKPRVYGDPDGPARQLKNQYEPEDNLAAKADAARKKLYGADYVFAETGRPVNDTMSMSSAPPLRASEGRNPNPDPGAESAAEEAM